MPATLMALRDAGWRIVNLACGLGRPEQHEVRRGELEEACRRAGFDLLPCDPPLALSADDDLIASEVALVDLLARLLPELSPSLVCAPSPHDGHHAHELVGRAARRALEAYSGPVPHLWLWGVWADLPFPDAGRPVRPAAARGDPARRRRARLGARAPADRPVARGARGAQRGRRRGARARLRASRAIRASSSRSWSARSRSPRPAGSSARRGASPPMRRSRRPRSARSAGGWPASRCTRACGARLRRTCRVSARRDAARRGRSGTRA